MAQAEANIFLESLSPEVSALLGQDLKLLSLTLGDTLMEESLAIDWVYFPVTAVLSFITQDSDGTGVETSMAGREGVAGLLEACGSGQSSVNGVVQVDGLAWRAPAILCRQLVFTRPEFAAAAWRTIELQYVESRQSGLCQATHSVQARFARWLLESLDRSGGRNPLPLTQEFLAAMLGVQRTTLSALAAKLQRERLITYSRGRLHIDDLHGLQALACECRRTMVRQRARLGFALAEG